MKTFLQFLVCVTITFSLSAQNQEAPSWLDYTTKRANNDLRNSTLLDYSYAGYHFSERELPDVSNWNTISVTDFGAVPNDNNYDDNAIYDAIDAAKAANQPTVIYFPAGRYVVSSEATKNTPFLIDKSFIVLKGAGSGTGGTEIFTDKFGDNPNGPDYPWRFIFAAQVNRDNLTNVTGSVYRGDYQVSVGSTSDLSVGMNIELFHSGGETIDANMPNQQMNPIWTRVIADGIVPRERHVIEKIEGSTITFKNPININIPNGARIRNFNTIEEVGLEGILFTSGWKNHPEIFVHHANFLVDYAWRAVAFEYVSNSWIRNVEFRDWNEALVVRRSMAVTVKNIVTSGKRGHVSYLVARSSGVLFEDCKDNVNGGQLHGPGLFAPSTGTVFLRSQMQQNQSIDSHATAPYGNLYDNVLGGTFRGNGGSHASFPHHAQDLVLWNFTHNMNESQHNYDFWEISSNRRTNIFYEPKFFGFTSPGETVTFEDVGVNELMGQQVYPQSLFDAQLQLRLFDGYMSASSHRNSQVAKFANDSKPGTRWNSQGNGAGEWLMLDLGVRKDISSVLIDEAFDRVRQFRVQYENNNNNWVTVHTGTTIGTNKAIGFSTINARKIRILFGDSNNETVSVRSFEINTAINQSPSVSIVDPTSDITLEEGYAEFVVAATATDSDGTISRVELFINDILIRNEAIAPYEWGKDNTVNETLNLGVGTHNFKVVATDDDGATDEASFTLTVTAANQPPSVSFVDPTSDITLEEGYATLEVEAAATDSDGSIADIKLYIDGNFIRTEGVAPYEFGKDANVSETLGLTVGDHEFRVVATDDEGATDEDSFTLTVTAANQPPSISFVDPTGDISLEEGYTALVVDATATDSDGTIAGLELYIDGVLIREEVNAPYIWGTGQNESETLGLTVGDHAFRVVATDVDGATSEDTFVLTVTEAPNQIPTVSFMNPTGDLTLQEGYTSLPLEANATDTDGTIAGVELFIDGQSIRTDTTSPYTWGSGTDENETLGVTAGTYTFRIVATDDEGATAEDTFVLTVTELPNEAPTVAFTNPSGDLTVQEGYTSLELTAEALDSDGTIASVGLFIDDVFVRNENVAPYDFGQGLNIDETLGLGVGTYVIKVIATDDDAATSEDTFVLTVTEAPNQIPTASFTNPTGDLTLQEGYTSLPLEANATDTDGTIAGVELFIDGQSIRTDTTSPYTWGSGTDENETLGVTAGIYTFRIVATDDEGATAEDTFVLTVTELPNEAPTVAFTNPAGDLSVQEGYTSLELTAEALDSDGTIASVGLFIDGQLIRNDFNAPHIWGGGNDVAETLGLTTGIYTIRVLATDDEGATAEDTFTLTVTAVAENQVPTVMFSDPSQDLTVQEGYTSLPLEANATDTDGTIAGVELFIDGQFIRTDTTAPYTWGSGTNENETLGLTPGTYTVQVVAIDNEGATADDTFVLTVTELPNEAPTVEFTNPIGDLTLEEGYILLSLEATAMDSDGTIAGVELFIDGQSIRTDTTAPYTWGSGTDTNETLGLTVGTYSFRIVATDDEGTTAEDTFTLTVTAIAENQVPTVMFSDPSQDLTVQEGYTSLPLEASASDADGTIASVGLYIDGQFIRNDFDASYTWGSGANQDETLGLAPGVYTLRVLAIDDEGATAEDTILLTVIALPNEAPTVEFTNPAGDLTVQEGYTSLELIAEASDNDGTIASVGLFIDGQLIRNDFNAPHIWGGGNDVAETLGLTTGSYTFTVIATDDEGATAEDTFTLTVTTVAENQVPTVMFSDPNQDLTVQEGYTSLPLEASASDADGTIASVGLYIDGQFIRNDFDAPYTWGSGANQDETLGLAPGVYTLRVLAIDDEGATAEDTILLTVIALPNEAPTVEFTNPTGDLTLEEGYISLPLTAQALDSDGTIESVGLYIDGVFVRNENVAPYDFGQGNNVAETLGLTVGSYTFTVIATDDEGATAEDTFTLTVTAVAENQAPGVAFTTPFEETLTVEEGYDSLELVAEAFDDDGSIVSVGLYIDGVFIRNDFEPQFNWGIGDNASETLGLTAGTYTFTVIATDNEGATAEDTFILTVEDVLSVDSTISEREISMYPNPAQNQIFLSGLRNHQAQIQIIDVLGRVVKVVETISNEQAIDISQLSAAPYIVQISIDNNFVIKHLIKKSNVE